MRTTWTHQTLLLAALMAGAALPAPTAAQEQEEEAPEARQEVEVEVKSSPVRALRVALRAHGARLGVRIEDVDEGDVEALDLPGERGAKVVGVLEETPAAEAGLREDDVILRWDGEPVRSVAELRRLVRETPAGRTVSVDVFREGEERQVEVRLEERGAAGFRVHPRGGAWTFDGARLSEERLGELRERMEEIREHVGPSMERLQRRLEDFDVEVEGFGPGGFAVRVGHGRMGVRLQPLTDQLAEHFGVEGGALVAAVSEGSPADEAGLRAGDVIVEVDGRETGDPRDVARSVRRASAGPLPVTIARDGERRTLTVELPSADAEEADGGASEEAGGPTSAAPPMPAGPAPETPRAPAAAETPPAAGAPGAPPAPAVPEAPAAPPSPRPPFLIV